MPAYIPKVLFARVRVRVASVGVSLARTTSAAIRMAMAASNGTSVLLGVMTAPLNPRMRNQWREWANLFSANRNGVDVRFVLGERFHEGAQSRREEKSRRRRRKGVGDEQPPRGQPADLVRAEISANNDFIFVDGREKLPHVGKVTEKSASWWLNIGRERPGYSFYCKSDDDTLVHLDRLRAVLAAAQRERPSEAIYFGHIKWRGWDIGHRFQACGGGWGPAGKTGDDIARGGELPGGRKYPPCPYAAGPYPYMSGGMVCMSAKMQQIMANDAAFRDFYAVARRRNSEGVPCRSPFVCAAQPADVHMWHHEDAGIGFNVFRAVVAANATASIVPVTGHYNDNGIIERTQSAQDQYWSTRAIFVHGIKGPTQFDSVRAKWSVKKPDAYFGLRCFSCKSGGTNGHNGDWQWARLPCPEVGEPRMAGINGSGTTRHCPVEPTDHFTCCGWPWVVPELVDLILRCLRKAPQGPNGQGLPLMRLHSEMRRELKVVQPKRRNPKGCVRDCLDLQLPGPQHMSGLLKELMRRGEVVLETRAPGEDLPKGGLFVRLAKPTSIALPTT
jgi:hypothetical protein